MSGPIPDSNPDHNSSLSDEQIAAAIREKYALGPGEGPPVSNILSAIRGFEDQFNFWYIRVMQNAVGKYRDVIIARINPFIRKIECDGLSPAETAERLIHDYNSRNFVTAGGWALEEMARRIGPGAQKSAARGIDIQRYDASSDTHHLYVVKSGTVTRNSDIMKALKDHSRQAEKLLRQGASKARVIANYAIAAGKTTSTFEHGIRRPSSAEFWGEMMGLPPERAIDLILDIAAEAGRRVTKDASRHIGAMKLLVEDYIVCRSDSFKVDWDFLAARTMQDKKVWAAEDARRHSRAMTKLQATGYEVITLKSSRQRGGSDRSELLDFE